VSAGPVPVAARFVAVRVADERLDTAGADLLEDLVAYLGRAVLIFFDLLVASVSRRDLT
jgi:hypothetical protein